MGASKILRVTIGATLLPVASLMICAFTGNALWLTVSAQHATTTAPTLSLSGAPVAARTPYTVVLQESTHGPRGDVAQGTMTMALRRDGAFVAQYEHLIGPRIIQRTIELPAGVTVVVDDIRERRTSRRSRLSLSFRARMDPTRGCIMNDLGELVFPGMLIGEAASIAGYNTVKVASGDSTFWFAPQVGCANLKSIRRFAEGGTNEKIATLIAPGDPDTALFAVPDRYSEVPPSVFHQMDPNSAEARRIDRSYFEGRPPQ